MPAVPSHLAAGIKLFDIPKKIAVALGTGTVPLVMTHTRDVGRFVVASLALEKWEKRSYIVGDRKSWNEVVEIAGKVIGKFFLFFLLTVDFLYALFERKMGRETHHISDFSKTNPYLTRHRWKIHNH